MGRTYRAYLPEQDLLLPPNLRDWLPENHLAHFVSDVVEQLDLSAIESVYEKEERGQPPYRSEIGFIPRCQHPEADIFHQLLLHLARRKDPYAIAVEQNLGHHPRMIRRLSSLFFFIDRFDRAQIQLLDHIRDKMR